MKNIEEFIDQSGLLLTRNVINSGISKDAFYHFVKNNGFEQVAHGVYVSPKTWADDTYILHIRCPAAVFSHEEALFYHHLTEREPMQQTITLYTGYNTKNCVMMALKFLP